MGVQVLQSDVKDKAIAFYYFEQLVQDGLS